MAANERVTEIWRTAIIDTMLDTYSQPYFFFDGWFSTWGHFCSDCLLLLTDRQYGSVYWLRIFCHYIIFLTPTYFPSGSQFTWFISVFPLFILIPRCSILFRSPQLTGKGQYVTAQQNCNNNSRERKNPLRPITCMKKKKDMEYLPNENYSTQIFKYIGGHVVHWI